MNTGEKADLITVVTWPVAGSPARLEMLQAMLSSEERGRLDSMADSPRAREFLVGRAGSRELLARTCGCKPTDIVFKDGARGKPSLTFPDMGIAFNLAHSGGICALAFGQAAAIGIDIEQSHIHFQDVVETALTPREAAQLARVPEVRRQDAFFRTWVAKEAYLKATGDGVSGDFHSLELDLGALPELRPIAIRDSSDGQDQWSFHSFDAGNSLPGAVAIMTNGRKFTVQIHHEQAADGGAAFTLAL